VSRCKLNVFKILCFLFTGLVSDCTKKLNSIIKKQYLVKWEAILSKIVECQSIVPKTVANSVMCTKYIVWANVFCTKAKVVPSTKQLHKTGIITELSRLAMQRDSMQQHGFLHFRYLHCGAKFGQTHILQFHNLFSTLHHLVFYSLMC
jgi:hypothetical protein